MRDFILDAAGRNFRAEVRDFLARELAPRAAAIEDHDDKRDAIAFARPVGAVIEAQ